MFPNEYHFNFLMLGSVPNRGCEQNLIEYPNKVTVGPLVSNASAPKSESYKTVIMKERIIKTPDALKGEILKRIFCESHLNSYRPI